MSETTNRGTTTVVQRVDFGGWQPIDTAPKDGEPDVLLFCEELGRFIGHWEPEKYPEDPQAYIPAGWWGHLCYPLDAETQPTHWAPLPPWPAEGRSVAPRHTGDA